MGSRRKTTSPANAGAKQDGKRDKRGRFRPGQSGNPVGKAPGTVHVATRLRALLDDEAEDLLRSAVRVAKADPPTLRALLALAIPPRRSVPVTIDLDLEDLATPAGAARASSRVVSAVAQGSITPEEGERVLGILSAHSGLIASAELAGRVAELEEMLAAHEAEVELR